MNETTRTRRRLLGALATPLLAAAWPVLAQGDWPAGKTITWVVPYPAGGSTDILGRAIAVRLGPALGATVIVDNKAGATGTIGSAFVARAPADGLTLLGTSIGPQAIVPHLMPRMPYDAAKAFAPVTLVGTIPHLLVTAASRPWNSVAELLAQAKARPGQLSFASGGNGTILQMQGELLRLQAGVQMTHVPYKGDTPAVQDVLAGHADCMFAPVAAALPHVQGGKLKALAVTSAARQKALPEVPTMGQAGFKDFVVEQWQAVYAPAGTPPAVVQRLHDEIVRILKDPEVLAMADKLGVTLVGSTPQQLADTQKADLATWGKVIQQAGIKAD
jgi:tripartite-type tricarboxylate transporter receptor subunit TctC